MPSRAVAFAAGAAILFADVKIDAWRGDRESSWQCPERISRAAAESAASVGEARSVHAEFIDGHARTLDLDVTEGGQARRAFRLRFPPQRRSSQFMLALFMNDGSSRAACVVQLPRRDAAFDMEFPLAAFRQALGMADYNDVDYILLVARHAAAGPGGAKERHERVISISVTGTHQPGALIARCR
jgi:hypothetical protein